jgi:hypothetical protein
MTGVQRTHGRYQTDGLTRLLASSYRLLQAFFSSNDLHN